jgi:hypothetical protein
MDKVDRMDEVDEMDGRIPTDPTGHLPFGKREEF